MRVSRWRPDGLLVLALFCFVVVAILATAMIAQSQEKPHLKAEVALSLRNLELKQTQRLLQMNQIEQQYKQIQKEYQDDATSLSGLLKSAVKDSGLDPKRYTVNADTLELEDHPQAPEKKE